MMPVIIKQKSDESPLPDENQIQSPSTSVLQKSGISS
jgi:hypothetical protein